MTTPRHLPYPATATATSGAPVRAADRDGRAWLAPFVATVLLALLAPAALLLGGMSAMATDSCGPDDCSSALMTSLDLIYGILFYGWPFTLAAYVTTWALPRRRRFSGLRAGAAAASLLPPLAVLFLVFTLPAP